MKSQKTTTLLLMTALVALAGWVTFSHLPASADPDAGTLVAEANVTLRPFNP